MSVRLKHDRRAKLRHKCAANRFNPFPKDWIFSSLTHPLANNIVRVALLVFCETVVSRRSGSPTLRLKGHLKDDT